MIQKTTIFNLRNPFLKVFGAFVLLACSGSYGQLLYSNGGLSTGATSNNGTPAPAGYTWSEVQSNTGNTTESNTNAGFNALFTTAGTNSIQIGDDFTVPAGATWNVTNFDFYGYQTNYAGTTIFIDQMRLQIWNGNPSLPSSTVIAGNMTTNVLSAALSGDALMYRIFNSSTPAPGSATGTTRKIWRFRGNLAATLPAGNYWVVCQMHAANDGNVFLPPVTIPGSRGAADWNAKVNTVASTQAGAVLGWSDVLDLGIPDTAPNVPQDIAFDVNGTVLGLASNALADKISIYPNPAKNTIIVNSPAGISIEVADIYDIAGKLVKSVRSSTTSINSISVSELLSGSYVMKLKSGNNIIVKNFIKE